MLAQFEERRVSGTKTFTFPAPSRGWVQSGNIFASPPDAAERLDNFFPTAQGARLRKGKAKLATLDASVARLMSFVAGASPTLYGSTETEFYDITSPASATVVPTPKITGLSGGDWSHVQFSTSGGEFFLMVNGTDYAFYANNAGSFNPIATTEVFDLAYDALTADFVVGETITGGTSSATATLLAIMPTSATAGTLKLGTITGTFQDNETITSASGSATSNIPSGTSSASTITASGVASTALSQVWSFKNRLFFVEGGTQNAWYLPVQNIGGTLSKFPLGSVFRRGGNLLFGATWSADSGDGLDDQCVFVSDQGEIAVYQGTDPSNANTWALVGVYQIGKPLNKHSHFRLGGELLIVTKDGIIPITDAVSRDRASLTASALTYPIEDAWQTAIAQDTSSFPVTATLWREQAFLLVGTNASDGSLPVSFVANARTGAWARYTGWDVRCAAEHDDNLYFGSADNCVYQAETTGSDDGTEYTAVYVPKFSEAGSPNQKSVNMVNLVARGRGQFNFALGAFSDYVIGNLPSSLPINQTSGTTWGGGSKWGDGSTWGSAEAKTRVSEWQAAYAQGFSVAPCVVMTSFQPTDPVIEILATRLRFESGFVF